MKVKDIEKKGLIISTKDKQFKLNSSSPIEGLFNRLVYMKYNSSKLCLFQGLLAELALQNESILDEMYYTKLCSSVSTIADRQDYFNSIYFYKTMDLSCTISIGGKDIELKAEKGNFYIDVKTKTVGFLQHFINVEVDFKPLDIVQANGLGSYILDTDLYYSTRLLIAKTIYEEIGDIRYSEYIDALNSIEFINWIANVHKYLLREDYIYYDKVIHSQKNLCKVFDGDLFIASKLYFILSDLDDKYREWIMSLLPPRYKYIRQIYRTVGISTVSDIIVLLGLLNTVNGNWDEYSCRMLKMLMSKCPEYVDISSLNCRQSSITEVYETVSAVIDASQSLAIAMLLYGEDLSNITSSRMGELIEETGDSPEEIVINMKLNNNYLKDLLVIGEI